MVALTEYRLPPQATDITVLLQDLEGQYYYIMVRALEDRKPEAVAVFKLTECDKNESDAVYAQVEARAAELVAKIREEATAASSQIVNATQTPTPTILEN